MTVKAKSESARISAIRELLDRGFGKPTQFLAGDSEIIPKDTTLASLANSLIASGAWARANSRSSPFLTNQSRISALGTLLLLR